MRPVDRKPLYELVSERLREFIDVNELQPGDRLMSERDLARQLEVGRSSIREAVTALRARGEIEVRHGDGIYLLQRPEELIPSLAEELVETHIDHPAIWETRQALETQCARLAAHRATRADLAELTAALEEMAAEIDAGKAGLAGDRRFHAGVATASHNPILVNLLDSMRTALDRTSMTSLTRAGQPAASLADHHRIYDAIASGESRVAADAMLAHLVGTTDSLVEQGRVKPTRP